MNKLKLLILLFVFFVLSACTHKVETKNQVELAPIEIKPIHITLDVNVRIKVDKELDDFFSDLDE